jgi:hypothetical protein
MLSPSPCSLLPAPMQPQPEILAYWTGSLPPHLSFLKMKPPWGLCGESSLEFLGVVPCPDLSKFEMIALTK